ncbi:MAG: hypothetical protein FJX36_06590 [Alphaproteobacteria bacterium]|nr:hypothetical protein [Alphaproteobacteria bacterium]
MTVPAAFGCTALPIHRQPGYALGDGRFAVVVEPPLGRVSQAQRRGLADIARRYAFGGLVEQGIGRLEIRGVDPELVPLVVDEVHTAGLPVVGDRS